MLYAVQAPFKRALLAGKTTHAAWRSKPSWYAVSTEDRTINPDLERFMAKRMGAKTIEVKASHLSLISQPDAIANLIRIPMRRDRRRRHAVRRVSIFFRHFWSLQLLPSAIAGLDPAIHAAGAGLWTTGQAR